MIGNLSGRMIKMVGVTARSPTHTTPLRTTSRVTTASTAKPRLRSNRRAHRKVGLVLRRAQQVVNPLEANPPGRLSPMCGDGRIRLLHMWLEILQTMRTMMMETSKGTQTISKMLKRPTGRMRRLPRRSDRKKPTWNRNHRLRSHQATAQRGYHHHRRHHSVAQVV